MKPPSFRPSALTLAFSVLYATPSIAQDATRAAPITQLEDVTVSATSLSLNTSDMVLPYSVLYGNELLRQRSATLGETLSREPGVRGSGFGPGASRPIIRGLDGPRVRVLSDGSEVMDASTSSPDHAVALEPMLSRRIEILRGPAALAYGGGAIGGVVNVLDQRIPTEVPVGGVSGSAELRGNTAANEAAGAFAVTGGSGNFAIHAEGAKRDARDLRVGRGWDEGRHVANSFSQTQTGSLGVSWVGERGYLGIAWTDEQRNYGLPGHSHGADCHVHIDHLHCDNHDHDHGHDDHHAQHDHDHDHGAPTVDLKSQRWDLRGELLDPFAGFSRLSLRASHTDYRHDELEGGEIGTRFRNKAHDARVELEHQPFAGWRGVLGSQNTRRNFSAAGAEAYVPPTITRRNAIFLVEEKRIGAWRFEAGLRHEHQRIDVATAGQHDRSHRGTSASLGANWNFVPEYSLGVSIARTQRLPTAEELYADGPHLATQTIEIGNPDLKRETSHNFDVTLRKHSGRTTFSTSVFHNRVRNYIYADTLDAHDGLRLIEYAQHNATFTGIEGEIRHRLNDTFALAGFGDYVRGKLRHYDDGADLPRIPAWRAGMRLDMSRGPWEGDVEWVHVGRQRHIASYEDETPGYNLINLGIAYNGRYNATPFQVYARIDNLTDKLAFNHASFNKHEVPLAGRNFIAGIRMEF